MTQYEAGLKLFPGDYVAEPADFPGLKLVSLVSDHAREYAVVRFYRSGAEGTTMRPLIRTFDCADAKRQYRRLSRSLRIQAPERLRSLAEAG